MKRACLSCALGSWEVALPLSHWLRISGKNSHWTLPSSLPGVVTSGLPSLKGN